MKQEARRKKQEGAARCKKRFLPTSVRPAGRLSPFSLLPASSGGFTLIELLVTISIFIFMTALIVSRYGAFNQGTLMTNLAYDVALSVRTAQTYGVSVKGIEDASSNAGQGFNQTFTGAYGVHFDSSVGGTCSVANKTKFIIFSDYIQDNYYDANCGDTVFTTYNMKQGSTVSKLCIGTDGQSCSSGNLGSIDIVFKRPDPAAIISTGGSFASGPNAYNYAEITLTSGDTTSSRVITVLGNGQITVKN